MSDEANETASGGGATLTDGNDPNASLLDLEHFAQSTIPPLCDPRWVAVISLGPQLSACSALVKASDPEILMDDFHPPIRLGDGRPTITTGSYGQVVNRELHPVCEGREATYQAFAVEVRGGPFRSWYEPLQAFQLYWDAWRQDEGQNLSWHRIYGDGEPEEIARWQVEGKGDAQAKTLLIKRNRLLPFLAAMDLHLLVRAATDLVPVRAAPNRRITARSENVIVQAFTYKTETSDEVGGRAYTIALIPAPPYDENDQPWALEIVPPQAYRYLDVATGQERMAKMPVDDFLTPICFSPAVLEHYHHDAFKYTVSSSQIMSRLSGWELSIARNAAGNIQAYLGDLGDLPLVVQQHWQSHAVLDQHGAPSDRIERDRKNKWTSAPLDEIERLRAAVEEVNEASRKAFGHVLILPPSEMQHERIQALRILTSRSITAFQAQIVPLAIWLIDGLNAKAISADLNVEDGDGTLNRLKKLVAKLSQKTDKNDADSIGGLFAILSLRTGVGAHRADKRAAKALERSNIDIKNLPAGFIDLVRRATADLQGLASLFVSTEDHHMR